MARTKDTSGSRTDRAPARQGASVTSSSTLYTIEDKNQQYVDNFLRFLLDAPEQEHLYGAVLAGVTRDGRLVKYIAGRHMHNLKEAHWAASALASELLECSLKEEKQNG
jgi:hypothetical protein